MSLSSINREVPYTSVPDVAGDTEGGGRMNSLAIRRVSPTAIKVAMQYRCASNWEAWALLTADHHWDHPQCQRKLLARHSEQAAERGAAAFAFGDTFCVMQGKSDRRADKGDLRPEHAEDAYFDALVNTGAEWYGQWPDVWRFFSPGNHEDAVLNSAETDLTTRLVNRINDRHGGSAHAGTYAGWVMFAFEQEAGGGRQTVNLMYTHGEGGGGPVTRGVIQTNRRAVYQPDANIVLAAHIHEAWVVEIPRERLTTRGRSYLDEQLHVQLPTYKEEYLSGRGYHRRRGRPPKPMGGWWLRFYYSNQRGRVVYQAIRTEQ